MARRAGPAASGVCARGPGCWSSHRRTSRIHRRPRLALPASLGRDRGSASLRSNCGIARKDPTAVLPRADRIRVEPSPDGGIADVGDQPPAPPRRQVLATLKRESGRSAGAGSSHARALTCTTTSGGKRARSPGSRLILQSRQTLLEKPFAPLANDFAARMQARSNLVVAQATGGEEDHLGADDLIIR